MILNEFHAGEKSAKANMFKMSKETCEKKIEQRVKGTFNTKIAIRAMKKSTRLLSLS